MFTGFCGILAVILADSGAMTTTTCHILELGVTGAHPPELGIAPTSPYQRLNFRPAK